MGVERASWIKTGFDSPAGVLRVHETVFTLAETDRNVVWAGAIGATLGSEMVTSSLSRGRPSTLIPAGFPPGRFRP